MGIDYLLAAGQWSITPLHYSQWNDVYNIISMYSEDIHVNSRNSVHTST